MSSPTEKKHFTTYDLARFTGSNPSTVHKWLEKGLIAAWKTPGGHRRIDADEVREFLGKLGMPIPAEVGGVDGQARVVVVLRTAARTAALADGLRKARPRWEVVPCESGLHAVLGLERLAPDALVLDAGLTDLDTAKLVALLSSRGVPPKCVVATGVLPSSKRGVQLIIAGARAVLPDPVRAPELAQHLDALLGLRLVRGEP